MSVSSSACRTWQVPRSPRPAPPPPPSAPLPISAPLVTFVNLRRVRGHLGPAGCSNLMDRGWDELRRRFPACWGVDLRPWTSLDGGNQMQSRTNRMTRRLGRPSPPQLCSLSGASRFCQYISLVRHSALTFRKFRGLRFSVMGELDFVGSAPTCCRA